jgi:transposase-like protein
MKSQQRYCPHCNSFDIQRTKRGFLKKVLLRVPPLYKCNHCNKVFTAREMSEKNRASEGKA